ncbi:MAG: zinc-binding dehydrogenase [Luteimonas sp.]
MRSKEYLRGLGADSVLDYSVVHPSTMGEFDVILDTVGSETRSFRRLLASGGRMMTVCPDPRRPVLSMLYVLFSRIHGGRRVRFFSARPNANLLGDLSSYVERGVIKPMIDTIYPLERSADAHRAMEGGGRRGKQLVNLRPAA